VREPGCENEVAVVVEVTPSDYRNRAIGFLALGLVVSVLTLVLATRFDRTPSVLLPVAAVGYGIYCAVRARRRVTDTVLRIDPSGLRSSDGLHDHTWDGVVMVWVGSATGLRLPAVWQPVLSIFTNAGLEFAHRVGTRPQPLYTMPVGGPWRVAELCDRLSRMTDASIQDGTRISRRAAAASASRAGPS
jgi:hypothetical protein